MIVHNVEQGTPEWFALRAGKPTASEFSKLITSTGEPSKSMAGYAITLAGEMYAGKPLDAWEGNAYTERGKILEADARRAYAFLNDVEPETVGFVSNDAVQYGCSPDSLINREGILEIKCLKAENHIKAWKNHLASDRTSCHNAEANQFRLFLHAGAYWLLWSLRRVMPRPWHSTVIGDENHATLPRSDEFITALQYFLRYHPGRLVPQ